MARADRRVMVMVWLGLAVMPGAAARSDLELRFDARIEVVTDDGSIPADASKKAQGGRGGHADPRRRRPGADRGRAARYRDNPRLQQAPPPDDRSGNRRYTDESLFSVLGFRVMEFHNRVGLAGMLAGANLKEAPLPIALSEHLFSLDDPQTRAKIDRTVEAGMVTLSWERKPLLAFSEKVVAVDPDDRARFVQFVRYVHGGHPEVARGPGIARRRARAHWSLSRETGHGRQRPPWHSRRMPRSPPPRWCSTASTAGSPRGWTSRSGSS